MRERHFAGKAAHNPQSDAAGQALHRRSQEGRSSASAPCLEYSEPHAQANDATTRMATPTGLMRADPPRSFGPTNSARPGKAHQQAKQDAQAQAARRRGVTNRREPSTEKRWPPAMRSHRKARVCSATQTPPFPTNSNRNPVKMAVRQCAQCRTNPGLPAQERIKNQAEGQMPRARQQERRKGLDPHPDGEIRGTPNQIDRRKGDQHERRAAASWPGSGLGFGAVARFRGGYRGVDMA